MPKLNRSFVIQSYFVLITVMLASKNPAVILNPNVRSNILGLSIPKMLGKTNEAKESKEVLDKNSDILSNCLSLSSGIISIR